MKRLGSIPNELHLRGRSKGARSGPKANTLRVRIPWLLEVESNGLVPVIAAFLLCAMMLAWMAFR